jgi:hypothetical protein
MGFKKGITKILDKLPYITGIKKDLVNYEKWGLPGHFYSPIPDLSEVEKYEYGAIESEEMIEKSGLNFNYQFQLDLLEDFQETYSELIFEKSKKNNLRYYYDNPNYSYSDAIFYYSVLRKFKPKKVIEIGSGFSSCLLLDVNEFYFDNSIKCVFVEPYPNLLNSLIKATDNIVLHDVKIQEVDLSIFDDLNENDVLFVDSSHVLKAGSDLNFILFQILPRLKKGVVIHFHDVFYPFKYPKNWILNHNRGWNEIYAIRLFLTNNSKYEIIAFNTYLEEKNKLWFEENMPLCLENLGGSIWLNKV